MPIGRAMLVAQAVERGESIESVGAGKADAVDLTQYVIEIYAEHEAEGDPIPLNTVAAAMFEIWDDGGDGGATYQIARYP